MSFANLKRLLVAASLSIFIGAPQAPAQNPPGAARAVPAPAQVTGAAVAAPRPAGPVPYNGPPIAGSVQNAESQAVEGAEVVSSTFSVPAPVYGRPAGTRNVHYAITDSTGVFELQPKEQLLGLFVRATEGYAFVSLDELNSGRPITLKPWAQVKGTVQIGGKPAAGAGVAFYLLDAPFDMRFAMVGTATQADEQGRFTLDKALPGAARITYAVDPDMSFAREKRIDVPDGKTLSVTLGGVGRPVVGKIATDVSKLNYRRGVIRPPQPNNPENNPGFRQLDQAEQVRLLNEYQKLPEEKAAQEWYRQHGGPIQFLVNDDGSFQIADVPAGQYELTINLGDMPPGTLIIEMVGAARTTFTMPDIPGGRSDQALDIGAVPAELRKMIALGDPFPKLAGKAAGGEPLKIEDFKGKYLLVQVASANFISDRGHADAYRVIFDRFGDYPDFAMLGLTTDRPQGRARLTQTFGEEGPPWPTMMIDADALPEELELSPARIYLVAPDGKVAAKNLTGQQTFGLLDNTLTSKPDPRVVIEQIPGGLHIPFEKVPEPSPDDAATSATFSVVAGRASGRDNAGNLTRLNDGLMPSSQDAPAEIFMFEWWTLEGRIKLDLAKSIPVAAIHSYSWHRDSRAPQVYKVYGSDGTAKNFNPEPTLGIDPTTCGWTKIATVDSRPDRKPVTGRDTRRAGAPPPGAAGGRHAVRVADPNSAPLGDFRYLLFQTFVTETDDAWGHSFYGEIDVIPAN